MLIKEQLFEIYKGEISIPLHKHEVGKYENNYKESLIYGEITQLGVELLVSYLKSKGLFENISFLDLGSGNGRLVLHMGLFDEVKSSTGIEIYKSKIDYTKKIINSLKFYPKEKINLINDDITNIKNFYEYNLIFQNAIPTAGRDELLIKVSDKIKKGTNVISTFIFKKHEDYNFDLIGKISCNYSWMGINVDSYLYKKR